MTNRPDLIRAQVAYRLAEVDRVLPGASAEPPSSLVAEMSNDAKDRHVLALAVLVEAPVIAIRPDDPAGARLARLSNGNTGGIGRNPLV